MGINKSSMYAAFGDKAALFRRAMERYREGPMRYMREALEKPALRDAVADLLHSTVLFLSQPGQPPGCFSVQAALARGIDAELNLSAAMQNGDTGDCHCSFSSPE